MRIQKGQPAAAHEHQADGRLLAMIFSAAISGGGLRVCQFCGAWLGVQKGIAVDEVSHGMCAPLCKEGLAMGWGDFSEVSGDEGASVPSVGSEAARPAALFSEVAE